MTDLTKKGERTGQAIMESALDLFAEHGYGATTMRAVAEEAGVSTGNAYYYFESKEHLIQGFYARMHADHLEVCEPILERETGFKERLVQVLIAKIDVAEPYHDFSGVLFKTAADPKSPLNPFSDQSEGTRREEIELMEPVLAGSKAKVPKDLRAKLPELLWMYEMAIILFWIHDDSEGRRRTRLLFKRTADIVVRLVSLASLRILAPLRRGALTLLEELQAA